MKITTLVENTTKNENLSAEHGLSLYIEANGCKILFDMGQTDLFAQNAQKLGVDLEAVDIAVISHGHYDHGGGLASFLQINKTAPVYLSRYAFEPHYNGTQKYIGLDTKFMDNSRLVFCDDEKIIADGLSLYSCNEKPRPKSLGSFGLTSVQNGEYVPDDFRHEHYLVIEENGKKTVISGCSHKGIMDIADWFGADVVVGGFHYSKLPLDEKLKEYAKYLDSINTYFHTCHCTGTQQYEYMKNYMKNINYISTGDVIEM